MKGIAIAIRELAKQTNRDNNTLDLVAFISLSLNAVGETIDITVTPWEKRGYWVKADRFRLDWEWSNQLGEQLNQAIIDDDWNQIALILASVTEKVGSIKVAKNHRYGKPWIGAWEQLKITQTS
jgi:hypothetical protein